MRNRNILTDSTLHESSRWRRGKRQPLSPFLYLFFLRHMYDTVLKEQETHSGSTARAACERQWGEAACFAVSPAICL